MHHFLESAFPDLLHGEPAHSLRGHPVENVLRRPVATKTHLDEVRSGNRSALDETSHGCAMTGEISVDPISGVGVGIEMHDSDLAVTVFVGHCGRGRPRDRMVTPENDRHDAPRCDLGDSLLDVGVAGLGVSVRAMGIAVVDDFEMIEDLDAEIHVIRARFVGE